MTLSETGGGDPRHRGTLRESGLTPRIEAQLAAGKNATAQWNAPPEDPEVLREVNRLCRAHGARFEVRFYGWYGRKGLFDAALLEHLPEVRRLSVDCLRGIENVEALGRLPHLDNLHFGVYEIADGAFLSALPLEQLSRISLVENRKRNFDLAPLARCQSAEQVFIQGHTRNISVLSGLPHVHKLGLSGMPRKQSLDFVNAMSSLRNLMVILGSRESIDELAHPTLEKLDIIWVRQLATLGDLARFPALREFIVEDQLRLKRIDLTGPPIERLRITNCKSLVELVGIELLDRLEWLHIAQTRLDLEPLRDRAWPGTTRAVGLFSGSIKWNDAARDALAARGIAQFPQG